MAVNLGHEKCFLAIAVAQCLSHALFAGAAIVIPAVVEEVDAAVERSANDADGLLLGRRAKVIAADADDGNFLTAAAQGPVRDGCVRSARSPRAQRAGHGDCRRLLEKISAIHNVLLQKICTNCSHAGESACGLPNDSITAVKSCSPYPLAMAC